MAAVIQEVRPNNFKACAACEEATNLLRAALLQVDPNGLNQITVACSKIHKMDDEHPATAIMEIVAMQSDAGEEGATQVLKSDTVYCAGVLQG